MDPLNEIKKVNSLTKSRDATYQAYIKHYIEGWEAKTSGKKICYTGTAVPAALLHSFGIYICYPEIDGALPAKQGEAVKWATIAEGAGYSRDLCSYAKINLGRIFGGAGPAEGALPAPDFLVIARTVCTTYIHWFETLQRHYKVPLFVYDVPFWDRPVDDPIAEHHIRYWVERSHDLIHFLEEQTGKRFDRDRYMEIISHEQEASNLWAEIRKFSQHVPSPVNEWDLFNPLIGMILWRGEKMELDLLNECRAELQERVAGGITAIPTERHRLLFVSNPPWYLQEEIPEWLAEKDSVIVVSTINGLFRVLTDVGRGTFEESCEQFVKHWTNIGFDETAELIAKEVREWKCDGVVLMDNRACKAIAFPIPEVAKMLEEKHGIPCLRFEGNMADPRDLDVQKVRAQLDGFIELLDQH
jgi:benzoyl-CoA reductase/2-hydroxyglutaryl-CoA dehydratase subunit BcrC/BadD/HgdB